jgi:hypothetical protein
VLLEAFVQQSEEGHDEESKRRNRLCVNQGLLLLDGNMGEKRKGDQSVYEGMVD